jgi:hypothetical protein
MKQLAPNLFQRRFQDFTEIAHARIPALSPEWTDHNAHDPGIMLVELLAWVAEAQLYSLSRQRRDERAAYAALLGIAPSGTQPARGIIWNNQLDPNSPAKTFDHSVVIPQDAVLNTVTADTPTFRPVHRLIWIPGEIRKLESRLADGSVIDLTATNQRDGVAFQPFGETAGAKDVLRLTFASRSDSGWSGKNPKDAQGAWWAIGVRAAAIPEAPSAGATQLFKPCHSPLTASLVLTDQRIPLQVMDDSTAGLLTTGALMLSLDNVPDSVTEFTIEFQSPRGSPRPPRLLRIEPSVVPIEQGQAILQERADPANGLPDFSFTLQNTGLKFQAGQSPLTVEVQEPDGLHTWELSDDLSQSGPDDRVYSLDTMTGAVTFSNGVNGKVPAAGSGIFASYAVCDGAQGNLARNRTWSVMGFPGTFGINIDAVTGGTDVPGLLDQRREARRRSRSEHALITSYDILDAAKALPALEVARGWVLQPDQTRPQTGVVTLVAMRRRPASGEPVEIPETPIWLDTIRDRLRARVPLGTRLEVVAPTYILFSISANLESELGRDPARVKQDVETALKSRLTLVDTGAGMAVRAPGASVSPRDVAAWIRLVPGVSRIITLQLFDSAGREIKTTVAVPPRGLPRYDFRNSAVSVSRSGRGGAQ